MNKHTSLLISMLLLVSTYTNAQTFWTENFESGSTSGLTVESYTGPNGTWTNTVTGAEGTAMNKWYVSCAEGGKSAGLCGAPCGSGDLGATLHLGAHPSISGDLGAIYFTGGCTSTTTTYGYVYSTGMCAATDRRAESPVINCSAKATITLSYYYIQNGQGMLDYGSVWYYDGTTWSLLENPPKTLLCVSGQGIWARRSVALPASADHNPNVKIGFRWINNEDGTGTDPSFALDSVSLSTPLPPAPVASFTMSPISEAICQDSCIRFMSTSTGVIDSIRWRIPGVAISSPLANPDSVCAFTTAGTYDIHLFVYGPGGVDSVTHSVTVKPLPHPDLVDIGGHVLSVSGSGYTQFIWSTGTPPVVVAGATTSSFNYTDAGTYIVAVDSNGCRGYDSIVIYPEGVQTRHKNENKYWITTSGDNTIVLNAKLVLTETIAVSITDAAGREILNDKWPTGTSARQLSTALNPGVYSIKLSNTSDNVVLKWVNR